MALHPFLRDLQWRGFLRQCTDLEGLSARLNEGIVTCYAGFDPTAPCLHVGSLMPIMLLRRAQKHGLKPIVLMGGGTGKVGDPSGKDESRQLMTNEVIEDNVRSILPIFKNFLNFDASPTAATLLNNADWLDALQYLEFLREYGRHFSINRMLTFDSIRVRLEREQNLSFLEFNYMLLQSYDFLELHRRANCILQIGGDDQWGNIVSGVELGRRVDGAQLYGLTSPLITNADGSKMGKTVSGAVWLKEERLPTFDYWQFWRNTADADVVRYLKFFTDLTEAEIAPFENATGAALNEAKILLADETTRLAHGTAAVEAAHAAAAQLFGAAEMTIEWVDVPGGRELRSSIAIVEVPALREGLSAPALFVAAGLADSLGEARRLIRGGGARLNDIALEDENQHIDAGFLEPLGALKLSSGKKRHVLVCIQRVV